MAKLPTEKNVPQMLFYGKNSAQFFSYLKRNHIDSQKFLMRESREFKAIFTRT
jgi:hypothetical protein